MRGWPEEDFAPGSHGFCPESGVFFSLVYKTINALVALEREALHARSPALWAQAQQAWAAIVAAYEHDEMREISVG